MKMKSAQATPRARRPSLVMYFGSTSWMVCMVVVWIASGLFLWWNVAHTEQQVRAEARAIASTIAATTGQDWGASSRTLASTIRRAAGQPEIAFVRARLPNGAILDSAGNPALPASAVLTEIVPVTYFNQQVGSVEVAVYRSAVDALVGPWVRVTFWVSAAAMLLSAAAAFGVAWHTTRPIRLIEQSAVNWQQPCELDLVRISGPREVIQLGGAVLEMQKRALARTSDLEQQVAQRTRELEQAYETIEASFQGIATALATALDARDHLTARHSQRTAQLAEKIGQRLGLSADDLRNLTLAATLHDIGKIGVPEWILVKPSCLTPAEWAEIRKHPIISAEILEPVAGMAEVRRLVRSHHERWDGTGYPDGLKGEAIPLGSRIISVADTVEAMSARRHYRSALPPDAIIQEIHRCAGTQLDPGVVQAAWAEIGAAIQAWHLESLGEVPYVAERA